MTSRPDIVRSRPAPATSGAAPPLPGTTRIDVVDAARGFAVAMMIAYHFCFDLTFYGWARWPMLDDARWIAWRSTIVGCFLFMVGISLALRDACDRGRGAGWFDRGFVRRWSQIAGAALLVTAGSAALFPQTFIYFGVLHFVAVALWLCRRAPRLGGWSIAAGCAAIAVGLTVSSPAFDPKTIDWIGFAAAKPLTEDYVPLFPWLGVVLVGCGVGAVWGRRGFVLSPTATTAWAALPPGLRRLAAAAGRHSLTIYLLHQPLMLGVLGFVKQTG